MTDNYGGVQSGPFDGPVQVQGPPPSAARGLALAALVVGIVAFLLGWVPVVGLLVGGGAITLGVLATKRGQSKPLSISGVVLGGFAALTSVVTTAMLIFGSGGLVDGFEDGVAAANSSPSASASPEVTASEVVAELVSVPDVSGMTVSAAISELKGAGFVIDTDGAGSSDLVTATDPVAGTEVAAGSDVVLVAEPPVVEVPDVVGMAVGEANRALSDVGLSINAGDAANEDVISKQTPAAGDEASKGDMVTVTAAPRPVDKSEYETLSSREFGLIGKDPDAHIGEKVVLYGTIFQFDSFTGTCGFMAHTGPAKAEYSWDYDQNTAALAGDGDEKCPILDEIIEDDTVKMWATVYGSYDYDTQIGGSTTALLIQVDAIEYISSGD